MTSVSFVLITLIVLVTCSAESTNRSKTESSTLKQVGGKYKFLCWLPVPVKSHQRLFEPLLRGLVDRGHEVTLVTPMPLRDPPDKNFHQVTIKDQYESMKQIMNIAKEGPLSNLLNSKIVGATKEYIENIYKDPKVQEFLNLDNSYDALIMETTILNEAFAGLHHKYKAPIIEVIPPPNYHWAYYLFGIPYDTSYIVDTQVSYTDKMTFLERLHNTVGSLALRAVCELYFARITQTVMDEYLRYPGWEERPPMLEMVRNVSLVLLNTHFSLNYPYPLPPHAKEIAGINIPPPKPLPKDIQEFMDSATDGVIIFSLGSHISMLETLGPNKTDIFKQFFGGLKQKVLWKLEKTFPDLPANIKITDWFPQTDVLAHKNCRLLLTHGGYHSLIESVYHGVPMVSIPILADQFKNAMFVKHNEMGLTLNLNNITMATVSWTIKEVLTNSKYRENAVKRSEIYRDKTESPLETAIFWTEYVIRHNGAHHLKPAIASMPWYQQAMIDVYTAIALLITLPMITIYFFLKFTLRFFCNICKKDKNNEKRKKA